MEQGSRPRYRSMFWPVLLIGAGLVLLLANLNVLPDVNEWNVLRLWPLLVIGVGLDLLFSRRSPLLGAVLGVVTVGAAVGLLIAAPSLGWTASTEVITETFVEPLGAAASAEVELELSIGTSTVRALTGSQSLIEAEITHIGQVEFLASGEATKSVHLRERPEPGSIQLRWPDSPRLRWDIGLSPEIPLGLTIRGGVGDAELDLSGLQLESLEVDLDVGDVVLVLPAMESTYQGTLAGGVGDLEIRIEEGTSVVLEVHGDVGDIEIDVPDSAAVHVQAETDVGAIRVPSRFERIGFEEDRVVGESGTWETPGFAQAARQIRIVFDGGVGNLTLR